MNVNPISIFMRPFCLVQSCTLNAAAMRVRSLFTSFTFSNIIFSCSLISKERIYLVFIHQVLVLEILAMINLYRSISYLDFKYRFSFCSFECDCLSFKSCLSKYLIRFTCRRYPSVNLQSTCQKCKFD